MINIEGEVFVPSGSTYGDRVMYEKINYVATQGQTVFSVNYDLGSVDVYVNGIRLANTDFEATSLTSVTIASGLNAGDIVELVSFGAFTVADTYTKAETDNKLGLKANTADLKEIGVNQTWQDVTASRSAGVTYINTTGKPIEVLFSGGTNSTPAYLSAEINGVSIGLGGVVTSSTTIFTNISFTVPNMETYRIAVAGAVIVNNWSELR